MPSSFCLVRFSWNCFRLGICRDIFAHVRSKEILNEGRKGEGGGLKEILRPDHDLKSDP